MSNNAATMADIEFSAGTASGTFHSAPTMSMAALAWSAEEEPVDEPRTVVHAVVTPKRRPVAGLIAAMLFGAVTVVATFGAIAFGDTDSSAPTAAVVDQTASAPYLAPPISAGPVQVAATEIPIATTAKVVVTQQVISTSTQVLPPVPPAGSGSGKPLPHRHWHHYSQER